MLERFFTLFSPLAWPLATLIIALIFRKDLSHALGRVGRVKYRDLELTFLEDLHRVEERARLLPRLPDPVGSGPLVLEVMPDEPKPLVGRLLVSPSLSVSSIEPMDSSERPPIEVIETAWARLERVSKQRKSWASKQPELAGLVDSLRALRDRASRSEGSKLSREEARRFEELCRGGCDRIEKLD